MEMKRNAELRDWFATHNVLVMVAGVQDLMNACHAELTDLELRVLKVAILLWGFMTPAITYASIVMKNVKVNAEVLVLLIALDVNTIEMVLTVSKIARFQSTERTGSAECVMRTVFSVVLVL